GCHTGTCDAATGTCSSTVKADGASCSDGNQCTTGDTCHAGVCAGGGPTTCTVPSGSGLCAESTCDAHYTPLATSDYVALWHLGGDLTDASGNGNNLGGSTPQGVAGEVNQGVHYDVNACSYMSALPSNYLDGPNGFTFATWVKPDADICPSSGTKLLFQRNN